MAKHLDNKVHECQALPQEGVTVVFDDSYFNRKNKTWRLQIQRTANEEDLMQNHFLEEVGETLWTTIIEITHCPYCGANLYADVPLSIPDHGRFTYIDSSGWNSRIH